MTFSATLNGTTATIVLVNLNSTANLKIEGATNLGNELLAFVNDPSTAPVDNTPAYQVYPVETGLRITAMLEKVPGAYAFIGNGDSSGLHTARYDFNDNLLPTGARLLHRIVRRAQA